MKRSAIHFLFLITLLLGVFHACQPENVLSKEALYKASSQKAIDFENAAQLDSAYYHYTQAKINSPDRTGDLFAYTLLKIAMLQHNKGDFSGSEETITEALANYKGSTYLPYLYNLLASSYYRLNNPTEALSYYQKAYETSTVEMERLIYQNNIGLIHLETKHYAQSIALLAPLLKEELLIANKPEYARVQDNLGYAQYKLNLPDAFENLSNAWRLRDSLQDNFGLTASCMHLSEYYQLIQPESAKRYADLAYQASVATQSPDDQLEALKWLTTHSQPQQAKLYYDRYIQLNDSLTKVRQLAKNQFAKIKYDSKKATQEVIKYKNQNLLLLVIIAFILLVGVLLYFLYQSITKRKLQRSAYETETRISKRIHDELANDVFHAMTFTQTTDLQNSHNKESLLDALETIYKRTRDISKENSNIRTDEHFEADLLQLLNSFSDPQLNVLVKTKNDIVWSKLLPEKKIAVFRVLQELLINTKKHSQASIVVIDFQNQSKSLFIHCFDNGLGYDLTIPKKSGLQHAENRILAIQGTLTFDSQPEKGFRAKLIIPK